MVRLGFIINPVAGMGGRVGLKGTDGVVDEARRRGAAALAPARALQAFRALRRQLATHPHSPPVEWLTGAGELGAAVLMQAGFVAPRVVHSGASPSSAEDTRAAVERFLAAGVELVLFCGGDGTARDVCAVTGTRTPVLGIPAGVKMYSGVFGLTPERSAEVLLRYLLGEIGTAEAEVVDLDETRYRRDEWAVRLYMTARTPCEPTLVQCAKSVIEAADDDTHKQDIASELAEDIAAAPGTLYLLGPGSTLQVLGAKLGIDKTLLGIDAVAAGRLLAKDCDEARILALLDTHAAHALVLSPLGAQGFLLGRGNQPLSPRVLHRVGLARLVVVATPAKLALTPALHVDSGDAQLDRSLTSRKFIEVRTGYHRRRMVPVTG